MGMHPSKDSILVAYLQIRENSQKLITGEGSFVKTVAGKTCAVVSDGLKIPPVMLRKIGDTVPRIVKLCNFRGLPFG
jgi:hypothetical protein